MLEDILAEELIPRYQRAVVVAFPDIAQSAASQVAQQNGQPDFGRGTMRAALWRTSGQPVGGDSSDASTRTLPVVDPELDQLPEQAQYIARGPAAAGPTSPICTWHVEPADALRIRPGGHMSQFNNLWRSFTCGYLLRLLTKEYPNSNLPQVLRQVPTQASEINSHLDQYYSFIGVAYWKQAPQMMPGIFKNPTAGDALTYAEVRCSFPARGWSGSRPLRPPGRSPAPAGGVPGNLVNLPAGGAAAAVRRRRGFMDGRPGRRARHLGLVHAAMDLPLGPGDAARPATILQSVPTSPSFDSTGVTPPSLGSVDPNDLGNINAH